MTCTQYGIVPEFDRVIAPEAPAKESDAITFRRPAKRPMTSMRAQLQLFSSYLFTMRITDYVAMRRRLVVRALALMHMAYRDIAKRVGLSVWRVYRICQEEGLRIYGTENVRATSKAA